MFYVLGGEIYFVTRYVLYVLLIFFCPLASPPFDNLKPPTPHPNDTKL